MLVTGLAGAAPANADAAFAAWLEKLWPEAQAKGVSRATFDQAFKGVTPDLSLPDLERPGREGEFRKGDQAEFIKAPADYLSPTTLENLTSRGKALATQWAQTLEAIEKRFGVPRSIVLALWARETAYGAYKPPHNAMRALATQAYLGRRKDGFRTELLLALQMLEEKHVTLAEFKSSWAGAFGLTQFMPSDFYNYAVDFDGDGRRDLFRSVPDALASAAQQVVRYGWESGKTWGYEVRAPANGDCSLEGLAHKRSLREWQQLGYARAGGRAFPPERLDDWASLLRPAGVNGPAFLATHNFQVIKAYNFADLYALFVGHLADRIAGGGPFEGRWGKVTPMTERDAAEMQERLKAAGHDIDKIDGKVGTKTRSALGAYQKRHGLALDCWPTPVVLQHLRRASASAVRQ
jgi:lytic murein transglycosylase